MTNVAPDTATLVRDVLEQSCGVEAYEIDQHPASPLADLGLDSLALLELQGKINELHGVELPEDVGRYTLAGVVALIERSSR